MLNLISQQFGRLTVESIHAGRKAGSLLWTCRCVCGNTVCKSSAELRHRADVSCGCIRKEKLAEQSLKLYLPRDSGELIGRTYGRLTVIRKERVRANSRLICLCVCGTETPVMRCLLENGERQSCGCLANEHGKIEMKGKRFGLLTVTGECNASPYGYEWECICDCGNRCVVNGSALRVGNTKSCGCLLKIVARSRFGDPERNKQARLERNRAKAQRITLEKGERWKIRRRWWKQKYARHRDRFVTQAAEMRKSLSDNYIKKTLAKTSGLSAKALPRDLIEAKRAYLKVIRLLKENEQ